VNQLNPFIHFNPIGLRLPVSLDAVKMVSKQKLENCQGRLKAIRLTGLAALLVFGLNVGTESAFAAPPKSKGGKGQETTMQINEGTGSKDPISNSNLTGELLLEILLGELNNEQGIPATGYSLILDAAKKSKDPGLYKRAVDIALHARSGPSALEAARAWKSSAPASKEANRYVLDILLALNKVEQSEEPLRTDLQLTPQIEQAKAIEQLPQLYAQVNNKEAAATVVEQTLNAYKTRTDTAAATWVTIAKMRSLASQSESAMQALKKGLTADPQSTQGTLLAIELASAHIPGAEDLVKSSLDLQKNPTIRLQWVRSLIEMDRLNEAGEQLVQITLKSPQFPDGWLLLGSLQIEQSQHVKAKESLKTYLKLAADAPDTVNPQGLGQAYLMMAQIAQKENDETSADAWLNKIEDPQLVMRAQFQRASILAGKGKLQEAIALIENLPSKTREDSRSKVLAKAQLYREFKEYELALNTLAKYLKSNPSDVDMSYEMSMLAEKLKRYADMEKILRSIISTHPDYAQAYNALGFSLADRNLMLPEAKKLIIKALEFLPEDPFVTDSLGWVEYRLGNNIEALAILERAYASKSDPEIAAHLGEVMWILKKSDDALRVWGEGLKMNPNDDVLIETIKRLKAPLLK
jgi:tetratricopeptide (TPR) repeat protein